MQLNDILLICAALLPAVVLGIYIFQKDRVEKEPIGLLAVLLLLGVAICFPAAKIESWISEWMNTLFESYGKMENNTLYLPQSMYNVYMAVKAFAGVALVEEGLKFLVLVLLTRNNRNFNSLFDGLVYAVFVSLGFAAYENILYVLKYGWTTAYVRAIMSVPGHTFFAVLMGYYYSLWNVHRKAKLKERSLKQSGQISQNAAEFSCGGYLVASLVMPVLAHGLYDYCCFMDTTAADVVLYLLVLSLYGYCFWRVSKMSQRDSADTSYADALVRRKYPHLFEQKELSVDDILR